jgi:uncharacterized membrane protein
LIYSLNSNESETQTEDLTHETENGSVWLKRRSFKITLLSTFTALAVVFGYMLAYIPNIEVFTLTIFLSGFILGKKEGIFVGLLSSTIFTFFNPLGVSPPPLYLYQIVHYSLTGFSGGLLRNFLNNKSFFKPKEDLYVFPVIILFGFVGGVITFIYDFLSTFFGAILFSQSINYFLATYISGIVFTSIHLIGNILGFIFILPGLIQLIMKLLN